MSHQTSAALQSCVVVVCITIIVCVAVHHGHNGWLSMLGVSAVSGIGGYNLSSAIASFRRIRDAAVITDK
jgi:hypothetical protein